MKFKLLHSNVVVSGQITINHHTNDTQLVYYLDGRWHQCPLESWDGRAERHLVNVVPFDETAD